MDQARLDTIARRTLIVVLFFGAASAVLGGVLGMAFGGAGVPLDYLDGTVFSSFVGPGLILLVVVGGTQAAGAIALLRHAPYAQAIASVAGFGMVIWIVAELAIISEYSFLQAVYLGVGIVELGLVLVIAGVFRSPRRATDGMAGTDIRGTSDSVTGTTSRRDSM